MTSLDELRKMLGHENLTDDEVREFQQEIRNLVGRFLDDYFRAEFEPDDV